MTRHPYCGEKEQKAPEALSMWPLAVVPARGGARESFIVSPTSCSLLWLQKTTKPGQKHFQAPLREKVEQEGRHHCFTGSLGC